MSVKLLLNLPPLVLSIVLVQGVTNASAQETSYPAELRARALSVFSPLPDRMPGSENDTEAMVKLGRKLYFDKRLSADRKLSCNSCHSINTGGTYGRFTAGQSPVKHGERDSPTVFNAGLHIAQYWDGRVPDLDAQARQPMMNPDEMAMPDEAELLKRIESVGAYRKRFAEAFPGDTNGISVSNASRAIAAFERTLITRDRFDKFLNGKDRALSRRELRGLALFLDNNCQKCHNGPALGGNSFQKTGIFHPYANTNDTGRARITGDPADIYKFKVPSLRNVALTSPYFHDGKVATLPEAVRWMAHLQLDRELSRAEVDEIVAFLKTLSDERRAKQAANTTGSPLTR
ncbi:MAG TPA: cytochrome c peroxidase [Verrucomicrobiota bacterium]|nr:cytochrome c peroxidase [Verrucomicrobiota bacterium]